MIWLLSWSDLYKAILELGLGQGLFAILVLGIMYWLFKHHNALYKKSLSSKDAEIKRLVEDNKELRSMFEQMIREKLGIEQNIKPEVRVPVELPKNENDEK